MRFSNAIQKLDHLILLDPLKTKYSYHSLIIKCSLCFKRASTICGLTAAIIILFVAIGWDYHNRPCCVFRPTLGRMRTLKLVELLVSAIF